MSYALRQYRHARSYAQTHDPYRAVAADVLPPRAWHRGIGAFRKHRDNTIMYGAYDL